MNRKRPAVRTTKRKAWHGPKDRWEWRGHAQWRSGPDKPAWSAAGAYSADPATYGQYLPRLSSTESQRRNSLRKIAK